jgi:TRAP-type C4-dicarboxylate transport system permease small subunit
MHKLRFVLSLYLGIFSLVYLRVVFGDIRLTLQSQEASTCLRNLLNAVSFSIVAAIIGVVCWTTWRKWASARSWTIAASLFNLLVLIQPGVPPALPGWQ